MPSTIRRKWLATALVFSVQDRRNRARALREVRERKAALLALSTNDVAQRLRAMRPPDDIMDSRGDGIGEKTQKAGQNSKFATSDDTATPFRPPMSYEQWQEEGFPVGCWRPLLLTELYHPLEAEKNYLGKKYSLAPKDTERRSTAASRKRR
ncbi:hypothetical protein TcG_01555 [Trypanosoma cruzi]|nr:hypothetical protein BCY84_15022 [Trypanosoma cruzi cruzi]RNF23598.1 hypothetical protein TcG_01555 [Trypanosoma cruzi]